MTIKGRTTRKNRRVLTINFLAPPGEKSHWMLATTLKVPLVPSMAQPKKTPEAGIGRGAVGLSSGGYSPWKQKKTGFSERLSDYEFKSREGFVRGWQTWRMFHQNWGALRIPIA